MRCLINNHDLLTWPKAMAEKLASQGHEVIFCDNDSRWPPLLEYYEKCPFQVWKMGNMGQHGVWRGAEHLINDQEFYMVTDPDLDISGLPDDWDEVLTEMVKKTGRKTGLSLDDSRIPRNNPAWLFDHFCDAPGGRHPDQFGEHLRIRGRKCDFFDYPIDTTFAVYRRGMDKGIDGFRSDRPYWARHLPWHIVVDRETNDSLQIPMDEELYYYFKHAIPCSTTAQRMKVLLVEYEEKRSTICSSGT